LLFAKFTDGPPHEFRFSDDRRVVQDSRIDLKNARTDLKDTAFMVVGSKLMECYQGPKRRSSKEKHASEVSTNLFK
jgi:hypothetical protein